MPKSTLEIVEIDAVESDAFDGMEEEIDAKDVFDLYEAEIPFEDEFEDFLGEDDAYAAVEEVADVPDIKEFDEFIEGEEADGEDVEYGEEIEEGMDLPEIEEEFGEEVDLCNPVDCTVLFPEVGPCEKAVQNKITCLCEVVPKENGEKCDDLLVCTKEDVCFDGVCSGTMMAPKDCYCSKHSDCDIYDDGNKCNGLQFCDSDHKCKPLSGSVVICSTTNDTPCIKNLCNPTTGVCSMTPINEGGFCTDNNLCTINDRCVNGLCEPESNVICNDNDPCTFDTCEKTTGDCKFTGPPKPLCPSTGVCAEGVNIACINGEYICDFTAVPGYMPEDLLCDEKDNDCDGFTDETFEFTDWDNSKKKKGEACGTGDCNDGIVKCSQSQSGVECSTKDNSSAEKCDQKDNDCDGKTDAEDPVDLMSGDMQYCENQSGVCYGAVKPAYLCNSGVWLPCSTTEYSLHSQFYEETETYCDGYDNDCSGAPDEECPTIFVNLSSISGGLLHDETQVYIISAGAVSIPSAVIKNGSGMTIKLGFLPSSKGGD